MIGIQPEEAPGGPARAGDARRPADVREGAVGAAPEQLAEPDPGDEDVGHVVVVEIANGNGERKRLQGEAGVRRCRGQPAAGQPCAME